MSVKIRLLRAGAKHRPFYRVVVTDSRSPRDGRFIETLGYYDPLPEKQLVKIDEEKAKAWIARGATPSDTVKSLLKRASTFTDADALADEAKARRAEAIAEANKLAPPPKQEAKGDKERGERKGPKPAARGGSTSTPVADTEAPAPDAPASTPAKAAPAKPGAPEGTPQKTSAPLAKSDDTPKPDTGDEGKK